MSRRAALRGDSAAVSLFPFLAVLICTMGSLIVLLVIVVQQARVEAADEAEGSQVAASSPAGPVRDPEADAQRMIDLLQMRDRGLDRLEAMRLSLAEVEDHSRVLEDEFAQLEAQNQRLESGQTDGDDVARLEQERAWLEQKIAELEDARNLALQEQARQVRSYAIIPYEGVQGTRRRPIYIECRGDRVILQPEGIELYENDFRPPLGPGNPLAAALRSIREHWAEQGRLGESGEPYPLLVVRPDGARAYAAAREAMKSWDDEFGYELIDADMTLAFPPADPRLDVVVQRALADARARQDYLVQAAPSRFGRGEGDSGGWGSDTSGGYGGTSAAGTGVAGRGGSGTGGPAGELAWGQGSQAGAGAGTEAGLAGSPETGGTGGRLGEDPSAAAGGVGGSPHAGTEVAAGASESSGGASGASAPGERVASSEEGGAGGSAGVGGNVAASGAASNAGGAGSGPPACETCLANTRGAGWGVPRNEGTTIGYRRPIRVGLEPAALTIHRETGDHLQSVVVPLNAGTVGGSIDEFVAALWTYMDDWGKAGPGSYWKPVLNVEVAPGAEYRYAELARLLEGSGIEVTRK